LFEGGAKLQGGLDCATGEFRGELVEGDVHFVGGSATDAIFRMEGTLQGKFMVDPPRIVGSFVIMSVVDATGTFTAMR
jgi:hypothetical protein